MLTTPMEWDNMRQAKEQVGFTNQLGAWAKGNPNLYSYVFTWGSNLYGLEDYGTRLGKIDENDLLKADYRWALGLKIMYNVDKWDLEMPSLSPNYKNGKRWSSLEALRKGN